MVKSVTETILGEAFFKISLFGEAFYFQAILQYGRKYNPNISSEWGILTYVLTLHTHDEATLRPLVALYFQ